VDRTCKWACSFKWHGMSTRNGLDMGSQGQLAPYGEHSSAQTVPALHWTRPQDSRDPLASLTRPVSLGTVRADVLKYSTYPILFAHPGKTIAVVNGIG